MPIKLDEDLLRLGRLEDKFKLYEPIFISLHGIISIPADMEKIQSDLQSLRDSSVAAKEQLTTLFKRQDTTYQDMVRTLERQTKLLEKEIADCPIGSVVSKLTAMEKNMIVIKAYGGRLKTAEDAIDSFKSKGWDLLFKVAPWMIAVLASTYALVEALRH